MQISRVRAEKSVILRYKVNVKDIDNFQRFLTLKSLLGYFEKGSSQFAIFESPLFADYFNLAKMNPNHVSWAKQNLSNNGFIIENPDEKKELDVYVIESGKVVKKYNKIFGSSLKARFYDLKDIFNVKKQAKKMLKHYRVTYDKSSYDEIDRFRLLAFSMDYLTKKMGARFQKFLKKYNIKELKFDDKMYTSLLKNIKG